MNTHPFLNWHCLHLLLQLQKMFLGQKTPLLSHHTSLYIQHFLKSTFIFKNNHERQKKSPKYSFEVQNLLHKDKEKITVDQLGFFYLY